MHLLEMVIGIAGTAKNTGKTTTTAAILEELRARGIPIFLTSIGYDGEVIDNITGLPKPRLKILPDDIIATAEKCVYNSTAKLKILIATDIHTPLGNVLIAKVTAPGLIVTAGPNKSTEIRQLRQMFHAIGPGVTIVDGALNRIAPMAETDGIILATGAARTNNISLLAAETEIVWRISSLPYAQSIDKLLSKSISQVTLLDANLETMASTSSTSLLSTQDTISLLQRFTDSEGYLIIPGIVSENALSTIYNQLLPSEKRLYLVFANPIKLLTAKKLASFFEQLDKLFDAGVFTGVLHRVPLLAVTVNPFYPEYRFEDKTYVPRHIDFHTLEVAVKRKISVPVYNLERQSAKNLVDVLMSQAHTWESPQTIYFEA